MAGNVGRRGAIRKSGTKKATVGSGGQRRKGLAGRGATPKAEDRVYHKAYKPKTDTKNKNFKSKKENNRELVLGRNPVLECLRAKAPAKTLYMALGAEIDERLEEVVKICANRNIPILEITKSELDNMTDNLVNQGVALQITSYKYYEAEDLISFSSKVKQPLIIALDNMSDPRNLGAIIRSAAAFGVTGVVLPQNRSVGVTAVSWRTSAGAVAKVPVAKVTNLTQAVKKFAKAGFQIIGLDPRAKQTCYDYDSLTPLVVVVGSEGKGISRLVSENCDTFVKIPMPGGFESLNASVACGIVLSEFSRQRINSAN